MVNNSLGYRGYNGSRPYNGMDFPQHVQNFLIRNYCQKYQLTFLLSASEYRMPGCYMILDDLLSGIESVDGFVFFSIFMLPESAAARKRVYDIVLNAGKTLHGALEDIAIKNWDDVQRVEDIIKLNQIALTDQSMEGLQEFCSQNMTRLDTTRECNNEKQICYQ